VDTRSQAFTYVDDVARANSLAVQGISRDLEGFHIMNVGGTETESVNGMMNRIEEMSGVEIMRDYVNAEAADMEHTCGDFAVINSCLDWRSTFSIEEGLMRTYDAAVKASGSSAFQ